MNENKPSATEAHAFDLKQHSLEDAINRAVELRRDLRRAGCLHLSGTVSLLIGKISEEMLGP